MPNEYPPNQAASGTIIVDGFRALASEGFDLSILEPSSNPGLSGSTSHRIDDECSTPDPGKYHSVHSQSVTLGGGGSLASKMPQGRFGLQGTIVPRASIWGGSQGHNPHKPATSIVQIDPHDKANSISVDLSRVTVKVARDAIGVVNRAAPPVTDIDSLRRRQAATWHVMAQMTRDQGLPQLARDECGHVIQGGHSEMEFAKQHRAASQSNGHDAAPRDHEAARQPFDPGPAHQQGPYTPQAAGQVQAASWAAPNVQAQAPPPAGDLMSTFSPQGRPAASPSGHPMKPMMTAQPVTRAVTFGTTAGDIQVEFNSVIVQRGADGNGGILVLGLATDYKGMRFMPKSGSDKLAIMVHGDPVVYEVESFGIQFEHKGEVLTHFLIHRVSPV